jgi:protein-disulfide isomerase
MRLVAPVLAITVLTAALLAPSPAAAQADTSLWHTAGRVAPVDPAREPVYGKPAADFSLIVWIDPECPYCKDLGQTPEKVVDGSGGQVNLAVRLMPLSFHGRAAFISSATAICIGQQVSSAGYYRFLGRYLALTRTNGAGLPETPGQSTEALAREAGVTDLAALDRCVHAPETIQQMGQGYQAATDAGVAGTPAIVVRDNRTGTVAMADGALGADEITRMIRTMGARSAN